jgi:hypothetical protein
MKIKTKDSSSQCPLDVREEAMEIAHLREIVKIRKMANSYLTSCVEK